MLIINGSLKDIVADPGCLNRIPDTNFPIPGQKEPGYGPPSNNVVLLNQPKLLIEETKELDDYEYEF